MICSDDQTFHASLFFADFDMDGVQDNVGFMIKRVRVHKPSAVNDVGYRFPGNYGVEKYLEKFSGKVLPGADHIVCSLGLTASPSVAMLRYYPCRGANADIALGIQVIIFSSYYSSFLVRVSLRVRNV